MDAVYTKNYNVNLTSQSVDEEKNRQRYFGRKLYIIIVVVVVILLVIILAATLGIVLSRDDSPSDRLPYIRPEYPVILVSFDGFRKEYLSRGVSPNINNFATSGVQANFLLPQFPTKTFTSHYSIVTGLFPESHGIVFNKFYDPVLGRRFRKSKDPEFWGGEPIWVTAKKNGIKSASYFWVGSETRGREPTYVYPYDHDVPFSQRVQQVITWLQLPPEERPWLITLYFHEPDSTGHTFGPNSIEVNKQIKAVDDIFGQMLTSLDKINMTNSVNLILVSDHGMAATDCSKIIQLDQYGVTDKNVNWTNMGSVGSLNDIQGNYQIILEKLKCKNKRFEAYYKKDLPKRLHFSNNRRIDDIIVLSDPSELIAINSEMFNDVCENGTHGYDNIAVDMRTIFAAKGPSFVENKTVEHFSNVEIYNLLSVLLKINPAPNNGTLGSLNSLLVNASKAELSKMTGDGNIFRDDIYQFPSDEVFESGANQYICPYCRVNVSVAENADKIFNVTSLQAKVYQAFHLPWGLPDGGAGVEGCLMSQPSFIIGYSTYLRIPLWTANRVDGNLSSIISDRKDCFRNDIRLTNNQSATCTSYYKSGFDRGHLVSNADLDYNLTIQLTTYTFANIVPQHPTFNRQIWKRLENKVRRWALDYKSVYVISGSIFDVNGDGIKDDDKLLKRRTHNKPQNPAIPTHFYKIVTRCDPTIKNDYNIPDCDGSLQVLSFILRHTNEKYCTGRPTDDILLQNVARVKDIELLTGTSFFSNLPSLQLQAELKSFLPVQLWQANP